MIYKRLFLKIKIKSLAAESRIIRWEERRTNGVVRDELASHRMCVVRRASRHTHIAYGLIKGRTYDQIERTARTEPDWKEVKKMLTKYGDPKQDYAAALGRG